MSCPIRNPEPLVAIVRIKGVGGADTAWRTGVINDFSKITAEQVPALNDMIAKYPEAKVSYALRLANLRKVEIARFSFLRFGIRLFPRFFSVT